MKTIILSGGYGTRLSEYTGMIPKPMVEVGNRPMLLHIMQRYAKFGFKDFYLALGYKADYVKDYFSNISYRTADFTIDMATGSRQILGGLDYDWRVSLIDTGVDTMTGGRIRRMREHIGNETFMVTYGDGIADIDLRKLVDFHKSHGKMATITAVHPSARFGELDISSKGVVDSFKEKPQTNQGWVNGGFMVFEPEIFDLIDDDLTVLESKPLETVAEMSQLMSYQHSGFWQCMDTKRDRDLLNELCNGVAPWLV